MKIAILGATSQIAGDLIRNFCQHTEHELYLYARHVEGLSAWVAQHAHGHVKHVGAFNTFAQAEGLDAVLNFVGVGDPAKALAMGTSILDITAQYDDMALAYVHQNPRCKYVFSSSGAAYGGVFSEPVGDESLAAFPINALGQTDWYGVSKFYAETRHRALSHLSIVDVRVFNYLSRTQNVNARFFVTDVIRAIRDQTLFETGEQTMVRDFMGEDDFFALIQTILNAGFLNLAVDCRTKAPVERFELLHRLASRFGLDYQMCRTSNGAASIGNVGNAVNATGNKQNYYSQSQQAEKLGFKPQFSSLEVVERVVDQVLATSPY